MQTIKDTTVKGQNYVNAYTQSKNYFLMNCYKSYSNAKMLAELECRRIMEQEKGYMFKIISHNVFFFTCGWMTKNGLRVETPNNSYLVKLSDTAKTIVMQNLEF